MPEHNDELINAQIQNTVVPFASSCSCVNRTFTHAVLALGLTCTEDQAIGLNISAIRLNILIVYLIYAFIALLEFPLLPGERKYDEWVFVISVVQI